jgi:hypothetical protein
MNNDTLEFHYRAAALAYASAAVAHKAAADELAKNLSHGAAAWQRQAAANARIKAGTYERHARADIS